MSERTQGWWTVGLAPTVFLVALVDIVVSGMAEAGRPSWIAPVYLGFVLVVVGLPTAFVMAAAWTATIRRTVGVGMAVVALFAAVTVRETDDAQAGLAILFVPYVALPLGAVLWAIRLWRLHSRT